MEKSWICYPGTELLLKQKSMRANLEHVVMTFIFYVSNIVHIHDISKCSDKLVKQITKRKVICQQVVWLSMQNKITNEQNYNLVKTIHFLN